jgi:hypothetical protein
MWYQGEKFRKECKAAGKKLLVWTVNRREEMIEVSYRTTEDKPKLRSAGRLPGGVSTLF